ncbi:MAG: Nitrilase/cyanide hydratase and apolipoprotein N-acyltransferase [Acidobacteria bacterium]|nr:Nitrilase/cyanide hydratase and apolipoprotein N-acyltransferase [Acidobacteriota bacterium]
MRNITVGSVQFEHADGDKGANFEKIRRFAAQAAARGVEILAFPECCITGYWFLRKLTRPQLLALAEPVPDGPSTRALLALSKQHRLTIGAGLIERDEGGLLHNTYVVAMPDGGWRLHRKIHAFESDDIVPGDEFTVFDTPHGCRVGVLICYDCNINENVRIAALMGAEVLLAPHQTGGCASKNPHQMGVVERRLWDERRANPQAIEAELKGDKGRAWLLRWLPSRAHDNGMFVVFSNGVGVDDDEIRTGNAMILDPYGRILAETWKADDAMVVAELDASLLEHCTGRRWITTRRPELYGPLTVPTGKEKDTRAVRFDEVGG